MFLVSIDACPIGLPTAIKFSIAVFLAASVRAPDTFI